ncbi:hypothetical protein [Acinetobacter sp. ANC 4648]|uniref:hypothetical protein n=1 Tax=Acinetobacter sp. ANC 4648 TaxID=1977875 RepID=UPI000A3398A1|nr:hypothetical protein [Acinetobacter sp. ANC 4648]OTG84669.1 hypothetical protein B9T27_00110 [Acinetobacter sp. ANC 4648]
MALDQIWKQQLTLVTYGNEYLTQNLSFNRWVQHAIFNQHALGFRDLLSQHLLAQHFQIWLEGLKKQGVNRISLHSSSILQDEQNPNANVELLPIAHFIVSHEKTKKTAWILGKELAEWYTADNDYEIPTEQRSNIRHETFWRFELNPKLIKRIDQDLAQPNWDDIWAYTDNELFDTRYAQDFQEPQNKDLPYYGMTHPLTKEGEFSKQSTYLPLLPTDYQADYAHETLHRLGALSEFVQAKLKHPHNENDESLSPDEQLNLRHFSEKLDDLTAKFVVKVANHYKSARLTAKEITSPFDNIATGNKQASRLKPSHSDHKVGRSSVLTLIIITVIICICAYYFGL